MPVVRTSRERMTVFPPWSVSRGITSCSSSFRISEGTPGNMMTSPRLPSNTGSGASSHSPGAVPHRLRSTVAPRGTSAWLRLLVAGVRCIRAKRASRSAHTDSSKSSGASNSWATTLLVMSSRVGPRPPVVSTAPVRRSPARTASVISGARSGTAVRRTTSTPWAPNARAISAPLLSRVNPSSSSVPMVTSSRFMSSYGAMGCGHSVTATDPRTGADCDRDRARRSRP